ncbi:MAG: RidA family protein [Gammaproteobacteria bacterium]
MAILRSNPAGIHNPGGFNNVVVDGDTVYVAGQVSFDEHGNKVGLGDGRAQAEQIFKNLKVALESVGSSMGHLRKINVFVTHREDIPLYVQERINAVPPDALPVSTLVVCSGLFDTDFRIEVEVIAAIP